MLVTSKRAKHVHSLPTTITTCIAKVLFKHPVEKIGITLDFNLTMNDHIVIIARTC